MLKLVLLRGTFPVTQMEIIKEGFCQNFESGRDRGLMEI